MSKRFLFAGVGAMGMTGGYYWFQKNSEEVVVIIGGGAMGTATAWSLSKRGHSCLLIDDGNPFKSSWGESRIVRETQTDPTLQVCISSFDNSEQCVKYFRMILSSQSTQTAVDASRT